MTGFSTRSTATQSIDRKSDAASHTARALRNAEFVFLLVGPLGWVFFYLIFRQTPGQDWMVFHTAVQAWLHNNLPLLLDGRAFTDELNRSHAAWLAQPLKFHPWVYPPYTLLLAISFGWLPWIASYAGFQAASLAGLLVALRPWCPPGRPGLLFIAGVLLCPATAFTLGAGQNSFFSAALVTGGIFLLPRRPLVAGLLLGLLAFKPQLAILVPVALLATASWRAIMAAAATMLVLLLTSLIWPGLQLWHGWLDLFLSPSSPFKTWINEGRLHGQSVFTCLHLLGVPDRLANLGQLLALGFGGICVWFAFRSALPPATKLAVLLCAMILGAAHVGNYDAVMLGIAAMLVLAQGFSRPFQPGEAILAMLVWSATALNPPFIFYISVITPLIIMMFLVRLCTGRQLPTSSIAF